MRGRSKAIGNGSARRRVRIMAINPVLLEIVRGSLASTIKEMEVLMERCAMSPFIKEKKDYFVGIFDRQGRLVCCHLSQSGPGMIAPILQHYSLDDMRPGDVYWYNDPYLSGGAVQHHQDMVFAVPVFDRGGVVAFCVTYGHYQDIGGVKPGSISPQATEIFHEGTLVPPVRIYREGRLNDEAYRIFLRNSRLPEMVEGDTKAMMASCRLAESRVVELFQRYGQDAVLEAFDAIIAQTAARARALFLDLIPEGEYRFHDYLDTDGVSGRPYRVALRLSRRGDRVELDARESDEQAAGPINYVTHLGLVQMAYGRWLLALDPSLEVNDGLLRHLDAWLTREGSLLQPRFPAPCGMRMHTHYRLVAGIFGTLAQANGGQVPANSPVYVLYYFRSREPRTGKLILCIEGLGVGLGAKPWADGLDVIYYIAQENYPVEYVEREFPLRIEQYAIRPDSGGPGAYRGGCGVIRDVRVLCDTAELGMRMEHCKFPPYGVAGGRAGRPGKIVLNPGTPAARELPPVGDGVQLKRGDLVRLMTCGGGGWGDPLARDPSLVQQDVARGFVSLQGALEDYGVVLDPLSLEIAKTATEARRQARRRTLPLFDRGPDFAAAEAEWRAKRAE
jgi:N-methylhydantoinase B